MKKKEYIIPKIEVTHIDAEEMLHLPGASRFDNNGDGKDDTFPVLPGLDDDDDAIGAKPNPWGTWNQNNWE